MMPVQATVGEEHVRDAEHPCADFEYGPPDREGRYEERECLVTLGTLYDGRPWCTGTTTRVVYVGLRPCAGDGHYMCRECKHKRAEGGLLRAVRAKEETDG
jgi:hypothetical protein